MSAFLLDANILIALTLRDHEHHDIVARWAASVEKVAVCPVTEGALVRFLVRLGEGPQAALAVIGALHASDRCSFWEDSLSYREIDLSHVRGHRQVTDSYLAALAAHRGGRLATLDRALAAAHPDSVTLVE